MGKSAALSLGNSPNRKNKNSKLKNFKFHIIEEHLYFKQVLHNLSNEVARKCSPFKHFTELNFDSVDLKGIDWLLGWRLLWSAFDDLKDADVFVLGFDHEVVFGDGSEGLDVGNG